MRTQEVKANKDNLYVVMESVAELMQEVIVKTGYQNIEKRKLSSSVFTIDGDLVREGAALGLDNMLQGKIPGMNVMGSDAKSLYRVGHTSLCYMLMVFTT